MGLVCYLPWKEFLCRIKLEKRVENGVRQCHAFRGEREGRVQREESSLLAHTRATQVRLPPPLVVFTHTLGP